MKYNPSKRAVAVYCGFLMCLCFLCARLYRLSEGNRSLDVLGGQYSRKLDVAQRSAFVYDRNMQLISHKPDGYIILTDPAALEGSVNSLCAQLSDVSDKDADGLSDRLLSGKTLLITADGSADVSELSEKKGMYVFPKYAETDGIAVHLMGYKNSDGIGMSGLQKEYTGILSELSGNVSAVYQANAVNAVMTDGGFTVCDKGYTTRDGVVLTIDKELQEFCDNLGKEYIDCGAVVVCDVKTGEILACSSFPEYDQKRVGDYLNSDRAELVNRVEKTFTPGSVFKLVVAAAALEQSKDNFDFEYTCTGSIEVGGETFRCHKKSGHGAQTLSDAFANSCNTYFVALGRKIGMEQIVKTARNMGLGQPVFADILSSDAANLPDNTDSDEKLLANISFGQGTLLVSPLDMINVTNVCATGFLPTLSAVKGIYSGQMLKQPQKNEPVRVLSDETVAKMKIMMRKCVTDGTGNGAFIKSVPNGGKTATAQTGQRLSDGSEILHRWFCGVYPLEDPKYSVCVLCDGNGRTRISPAEIFKIVNKFLINRKF